MTKDNWFRTFSKALRLDPQSPHVQFMYSWNFALNNRLEESIDVLDAIIKETPELQHAKYALFIKSALQGNKESALNYATDELKKGAASQDYLPINMAWGYTLIGEAEEAVKWLRKSLDFSHPYPLMSKFEIFHRVLKDHGDFQAYMQEIKNDQNNLSFK